MCSWKLCEYWLRCLISQKMVDLFGIAESLKCFLRMRSKILFKNNHTLHYGKLDAAWYKNSWLISNEYEETASDHRPLAVTKFSVATGHIKLKFPYHANKMFTFKVLVIFGEFCATNWDGLVSIWIDSSGSNLGMKFSLRCFVQTSYGPTQ